MSKHKKVGDRKDEVGKAGSPPSGTENERSQKGETKRPAMPKISKGDVGGSGGGKLH